MNSDPRKPSWLREHRQNVLAIVGYYAALAIALLVSKWFIVNPSVGTVVILLALLAPFVIGRLSVIEYGNVKVQLRDLQKEVKETRTQVTQEVAQVRQEVSQKIAEWEERARDYLGTDSLMVADAKVAGMRETINISDEEVGAGLTAHDPERRVPSYLQLQVRPNVRFAGPLASCFQLERQYAAASGDTRPLWQLLVAVQVCYESEEIPDSDYDNLLLSMRRCLEFLVATPIVDRGGQCKKRLREMIARFGANRSRT
jgi:hypothetical protein